MAASQGSCGNPSQWRQRTQPTFWAGALAWYGGAVLVGLIAYLMQRGLLMLNEALDANFPMYSRVQLATGLNCVRVS